MMSSMLTIFCSGYMAPEYAIDGQFSVKSDVFSFGILVLEIISGKKNKGFYNPNHEINMIGDVSRKTNFFNCYCTLRMRMTKTL